MNTYISTFNSTLISSISILRKTGWIIRNSTSIRISSFFFITRSKLHSAKRANGFFIYPLTNTLSMKSMPKKFHIIFLLRVTRQTNDTFLLIKIIRTDDTAFQLKTYSFDKSLINFLLKSLIDSVSPAAIMIFLVDIHTEHISNTRAERNEENYIEDKF
jgi:hypothetical protein